MNGSRDHGGLPVVEGEAGGAGSGAEPPRTPATSDSGDPGGGLPPLGNTGGNSSSEAIIGLGWLKMVHTSESYRVWEKYRRDFGLDLGGIESIGAGRQHRVFGAEWGWGGCEYWCVKGKGDEREQPWYGLEWFAGYNVEELRQMQRTGVNAGDPAEHRPMTEWSDKALAVMTTFLGRKGASLMQLISDLRGRGARATRLDLSCDFSGASIEPVEHARTVRDYLPFRCDKLIDSRHESVTGGRTCYFGKRGADGSGKFVRFYEKGREQGLRVDLLRYEVELTAEYGDDAAKWLAEAGDAWELVAQSILADVIDFREGYGLRRGGQNAGRDTVRYAWWQALLNRLCDAVKLRAKIKPAVSLLRMERWAEKAWPRCLAMLQRWKGDDFLWELLRKLLARGQGQLSERDLALVRLVAENCIT